MDQQRRIFLKRAGIAGAAIVSIGAGLIKPGETMAAELNNSAVVTNRVSGAMAAAGYAGAALSNQIDIILPEIAENGGIVPVEVTSNIPGTTSVAIFVDKNPNPLAASFGFMAGADTFASTRIKVSETSLIWVAVKAGGKTYMASKELKVTLGGCGGGT